MLRASSKGRVKHFLINATSHNLFQYKDIIISESIQNCNTTLYFTQNIKKYIFPNCTIGRFVICFATLNFRQAAFIVKVSRLCHSGYGLIKVTELLQFKIVKILNNAMIEWIICLPFFFLYDILNTIVSIYIFKDF